VCRAAGLDRHGRLDPNRRASLEDAHAHRSYGTGSKRSFAVRPLLPYVSFNPSISCPSNRIPVATIGLTVFDPTPVVQHPAVDLRLETDDLDADPRRASAPAIGLRPTAPVDTRSASSDEHPGRLISVPLTGFDARRLQGPVRFQYPDAWRSILRSPRRRRQDGRRTSSPRVDRLENPSSSCACATAVGRAQLICNIAEL
jgi:hypothetical protein